MDIYSFEFGVKPVEYFTQEFKELHFIGTSSRPFPQNRNLIRIEPELTDEKVHFKSSTYYDPAIVLDGRWRLINHNENLNTQLLESDKDNVEFALAIVIIDLDMFRLVGYRCGTADDNEDALYVGPELKKATYTDRVEVGIIQFDLKNANDQLVDLIFYNHIMKKYEYYRVTVDNGKIHCINITSDIGSDVMDSWREEDIKRDRKRVHFKLEFNNPVTKYYVTTTTKAYELYNLLKSFGSLKRRRVLIVTDTPTVEEINGVVENNCDKKTKAITFYGVDTEVIEKSLKDYYKLILDPTGYLMSMQF